jgi:O-antigen polymerase
VDVPRVTRVGRTGVRPSALPTPRRISWPAVAILLAAALGALLPLARPGYSWIGVCALTLLPLAAIVVAGTARAATITAALVYVGVLMWVYTTHIAPVYAYYGLIDADPGPGSTVIVTALAALPAAWLPISARRPSFIVLWLLYLVGYVPATVVPLYIEGDLGTVLPFELALVGSMAILALIVRLPPVPISVPHLTLTGFTRLMVILGFLSLAYIAATFGVQPPPSLSSVYTRRAEFDTALGGAAGGAYIVPWAANAINPILMSMGMVRRRAELLVLGVAGQLLIYSATGFKSVLFSIALVPLVYLVIAIARRSFGLLATLAAPVILLLAIAGNSLTGGVALSLARRVFTTPGQLTWYYFDYFSVHPPYHLSHRFLGWLFPSQYSVEPAALIGSVYFPQSNPSANANLWADAFANFGLGGIVIFSVGFGVVLLVIDGIGLRRDARITGPLLAIAGLNLASSALFTNLLTFGLGLSCVLIALMPPASAGAAPARTAAARVRGESAAGRLRVRAE